jgi:hypothetical protein
MDYQVPVIPLISEVVKMRYRKAEVLGRHDKSHALENFQTESPPGKDINGLYEEDAAPPQATLCLIITVLPLRPCRVPGRLPLGLNCSYPITEPTRVVNRLFERARAILIL